LGYTPSPKFLDDLRKASGRQNWCIPMLAFEP
jgi:hypothetical protein